MQPNQQNQDYSQPQQPGNLPYQVPDYLQLEPLEGANGGLRKKRKKILLIISLVLLIVGLAGVLAYFYIQKSTPEEKFYDFLDHQMQISYIRKNIDLETKDGKINATLSLDASDPIQAKSDLSIVTRATGGSESEIRSITLTNKEYVFSIKSLGSKLSYGNLQKDQWYSTSFHAADRKEVGYSIESGLSPLILNSIQGIVPMGNFSSEQRSYISSFIRSKSIYEIQGTENRMVDGTQQTGYKVKFDFANINRLNAELVDKLGLKQYFSIQKPFPTYSDALLWVDDKTNRLQQMTYNSGETKDDIHTKQVTTFEYPNEMLIKRPTNVGELPL